MWFIILSCVVDKLNNSCFYQTEKKYPGSIQLRPTENFILMHYNWENYNVFEELTTSIVIRCSQLHHTCICLVSSAVTTSDFLREII